MAFHFTSDNIVKPTPEGAVIALSKVQYDRLLKLFYARVDELFCRLTAFCGNSVKPYKSYQIGPLEYIDYTIGVNTESSLPPLPPIGFDADFEQWLSVNWSRRSKYCSYSMIAPVPATLRTVSVDETRQLWHGSTRIVCVSYRSRLDNGTDVFLFDGQDGEYSLSIFLHNRGAYPEKMKRALTDPHIWDDNPRTVLSDPSAVVNRVFRRLSFPKETDR